MEEIKFLKPTWAITLKVWWSLVWRSCLYGGLAGGIFGGLFGGIAGGMLAPVLGLDVRKSAEIFGQIFGGLAGLLIGIWVIKIVLSKEYKDFKIALIAKE